MIDLLIVTGGSKGIGKNIVINSSNYAKKVLAIGSSDLINDVSDRNNHIHTIKRDISRIDKDFDELSDFLEKSKPSSIGLALCASKLGNFGGIADADFKDWENLYRTNVLGNLSVLNNILKFANFNTFIRVIFFGGGGAAYGYSQAESEIYHLENYTAEDSFYEEIVSLFSLTSKSISDSTIYNADHISGKKVMKLLKECRSELQLKEIV